MSVSELPEIKTNLADTIQVDIKTRHIEGQSQPQHNKFVYAYTITIHNTGIENVKLLSRHWVITDNEEEIREVKGEGVVGQQPVIAAGDHFTYTSGVFVNGDEGSMTGSYRFCTDDGELFDADIPTFYLIPPSKLH